MLEQRDKDGEKQWCLVSKSSGKVLKWFGAEKPSEEDVAKEEQRIHAAEAMNAETVVLEARRFRKDVIPFGEFIHPQKPGETIKVTAERVNKWINDTKAAGAKVYVPIRHSEDPRDNAGWVDSFEVDKDKLYANMSITDAKTGDAIANGTIRDVSIGVGPVVTEKGQEYGEVIRHVALTVNPHIRNQGEFQPLQAEGELPLLFTLSASDKREDMEAVMTLSERIGSLKERIYNWGHKTFKGGEDMDFEAKYKELETALEAAKAENAKAVQTLTAELESAKATIAKHEAEAAAAFEAEAEAAVDALIKANAGKAKFAPVTKDKWLKLYKTDKELYAEAVALAGVDKPITGTASMEGRPAEGEGGEELEIALEARKISAETGRNLVEVTEELMAKKGVK